MSRMEQESLAVEPVEAVSPEIAAKGERIAAFLDRHGLSALLLSRHENIAWATAGKVEARVGLGSETASTSLLITGDGRKYYIAPNNEGPRLAAEEFAGLGYEPVLYPWQESAGTTAQDLTGSGKIGSDSVKPDAVHVHLGVLRAPLLPAEIDRLRILGRDTAAVTAEIVESLEPGITEYEMAGRTASALLARGISPTVLLMGTDDRIRKYKHAVARRGVLDRYGMINLCARRAGMVVSLTRFAHFDPMLAELSESFAHTARINAELLHATRPGATASSLYAVAQKAYAAACAPEELDLHHQGGPCGYVEREWLITPAGTQTVALPQALAYNPSLRGAKVEDTVIVTDSGIEVLTSTPSLPVVETVIGGVNYQSAGALIR